jgi:hypothetical protein
MKTRRYTVTCGEYEGFHVLAQIEGPATPALSTLEKRFRKLFSVPSPINAEDYTDSSFIAENSARDALKAEGLEAFQHEGIRGYFIAWLVRDCGFSVLKDDQYFLDMDW